MRLGEICNQLAADVVRVVSYCFEQHGLHKTTVLETDDGTLKAAVSFDQEGVVRVVVIDPVNPLASWSGTIDDIAARAELWKKLADHAAENEQAKGVAE